MEISKDQHFKIIAINIRRKQKKQKITGFLYGFLSILVFLLVWQLLSVLGIVNQKLIATPFEVIKTIAIKLVDPRPDGQTLLIHIFASFKLALIGTIIAVIVGFPLGLLMGWYKPIDKFIRPLFEIMRPMPPVAWIPIVIVLLGIGTVAKSFIIFFTCLVPILINSYAGIRETSEVHKNFAKTCGYTNWQILLKVGLPSALPLSFAGLRIALGNGWSTLIAAEMLAANKGMGFMILMGRVYGRIDIIIAGMLVIGVIGLLLSSGIVTFLENQVLKWRVIKK